MLKISIHEREQLLLVWIYGDLSWCSESPRADLDGQWVAFHVVKAAATEASRWENSRQLVRVESEWGIGRSDEQMGQCGGL